MTRLETLFDLSGRTALVTGATGHLGRVICETLLEQGCSVALTDRDEEAGPGIVEDLNRRFSRGAASYIPCNLADTAATRELPPRVAGRTGRLDIVIHNAAYTGSTQAVGWAKPFLEQGTDAFDEAIRVNTTSAFVLAQSAAPYLGRVGCGSMIFVSSIYGFLAPDWSLYSGTDMANPAGYNVSKAGLLQLARYLATTLRPVRVNAISPGGIYRKQPDAFVKRYIDRTPLGRMATEDDFRGAVAFLASDASAYVTGHNLVVDGGWSAW